MKIHSTGKQSTLWPYLSFLLEGAQEMAFGYVLWWTLWTALIHGAYTKVAFMNIRGLKKLILIRKQSLSFSLTVFD